MLVKCICTNCAGHLEFEEENAGEKVDCPHCGFDTTLFLPGTEPAAAPSTSFLARALRFRRPIVGVTAVLVIAGIGWAIYKWLLPLVRNFLPEETSIVVALLVLLLVCIVSLGVLMWLALPLWLFIYGRKLARAFEGIEQNLNQMAAERSNEATPFDSGLETPPEEEVL